MRKRIHSKNGRATRLMEEQHTYSERDFLKIKEFPESALKLESRNPELLPLSVNSFLTIKFVEDSPV